MILFGHVSVVFAEVDQRCFTKSECIAARDGSEDGFYQSQETIAACNGASTFNNEPLGFCSPNGNVQTTVAIGGIRSFASPSDFIQTIFRFGVGALIVLSVIMIIIGGFQWSVSAGNGSAIEEAKNKIKKSIIGLVLVICSVTILQTINPYLVHLRLPQVWMINTIGLTSVYCNENADGTVSLDIDGKQSLPAKDAACGTSYYAKGAGSQQCTGLMCPDKQTCSILNDGSRACKTGMLSGTITAQQELLSTELQGNIIDNNLTLIAICNNGRLEEIDDIDIGVKDRDGNDHNQSYLFPYNYKIETACSQEEGLVGFFLGAEINDEGSGILGSFAPGSLVSAGIDDWHAIGKQFQTTDQTVSHSCHDNLSLRAFELLHNGGVADCRSDEAVDICSCAGISQPSDIKRLIATPSFVKQLITREELKKGFTCDIHITRLAFPAIDNIDLVEDDTDCFEYQ